MHLAVGLLLAPALILAIGAALTLAITGIIVRRFPPDGCFVDVQGGRLHYLEAAPDPGEARGTVVLLHGASSNAADSMLALGRSLSARYRVIAFDRPGHGWSDRIAGGAAATPAVQAALIAEAMRSLGVRRAVVVGHSLSGAVVPHFALDHRDVTGAIAIVAGVTHPWPGGKISWYYGPAASWAGWLFTRTLTTPLGMLLMGPTIREVFAPQEPPPDYTRRARIPIVLRPASFQANAEDVAGLFDAVQAQSPRYGAIQVPAVAIGGDADRVVWTDLHARSFAREVPHARLVVLPQVGHMPHHVARETVLAEIDALAAAVAEPAAEREAFVPRRWTVSDVLPARAHPSPGDRPVRRRPE
jgi:pimeloyl-ACP methyl ester carboxylesterase